MNVAAIRYSTGTELWLRLQARQAAESVFARVGAFSAASAGQRKPVTDKSGIKYRKASLADARPIEWAWLRRILLGYITLLVGVEGIGKGNLVAWILAQITQGKLAGDLYGRPGAVAIIGDEDDYENVWVPRLHVAGANLDLVYFIEAGSVGTLDVKKDAEALREFIVAHGVAILYFDQLLDNLGVADSWKAQEIRNVLAPLRRIAHETGIALLTTLHPNKRRGSFREMIAGTPAFNALGKSGLLVMEHPDEPDRVVAVRAKGNYSKRPEAFEFRIEERVVKPPGPGKAKRTITTSCITSIRETDLRADQLLNGGRQSRLREDSKAGHARRLLADMLADGEAHRVADIQEELWKKYKLNGDTIANAATHIGVTKWQEGFPGAWYYRLGE